MTAGVGVPLLLAAVFVYDGRAIPILLAVLVGLLLWECATLLNLTRFAMKAGYTTLGVLLYSVFAMSDVSFLEDASTSALFFLIVFLVPTLSFGFCWIFAEGMQKFYADRQLNDHGVTDDMSTGTRFWLGIACFAMLLGMCLALFALHQHYGAAGLLTVLMVAWVTDTGAYFVGRAVGKHPLVRKISPNKTLEGFFGGYGIGLIATLLLGFLWLQPVLGWSTVGVVALGLATPLFAVIGDLVASMFKRVAQVKDSGGMLPGHGGLLDRVDSIVYVAPSMLVLAGLTGGASA